MTTKLDKEPSDVVLFLTIFGFLIMLGVLLYVDLDIYHSHVNTGAENEANVMENVTILWMSKNPPLEETLLITPQSEVLVKTDKGDFHTLPLSKVAIHPGGRYDLIMREGIIIDVVGEYAPICKA